MFKGFMDEAGLGKDDAACAVAGFIGSADACDQIAEKWAEAVRPIGYFHAEEFFKRPDGEMVGEYRGIEVSDAESCVFKLIELTKSSQLTPIGIAINANVFKSLAADEKRWMTSAVLYGKDWPSQGSSNPYFACFHYCITEANQFTPEHERVYLTFDRQETYMGNAQKIYNQLKATGGKWGERLGESLVFSSKTQTALLQAADLLAYSIGQFFNKGPAPRNKVVQYVLDNLAYQKKYVVAMGVESIDVHLKNCPFRTTFWEGLSDPDLLEQVAAQNHKVLTYKASVGLHLAHHLKVNKVKIIAAIAPQPLGGLNLTDARDDSTK